MLDVSEVLRPWTLRGLMYGASAHPGGAPEWNALLDDWLMCMRHRQEWINADAQRRAALGLGAEFDALLARCIEARARVPPQHKLSLVILFLVCVRDETTQRLAYGEQAFMHWLSDAYGVWLKGHRPVLRFESVADNAAQREDAQVESFVSMVQARYALLYEFHSPLACPAACPAPP